MDLYNNYEPCVVYCWLISQWSLERFGGFEGANYDFIQFNPGLYDVETIRKALKTLRDNGFIKYVYKTWRRLGRHVFKLRKIISAVGSARFKKIPAEYKYNTIHPDNLPSSLDILEGNEKNGPPSDYSSDLLYFLSKHQESLNFSKDSSRSNFKNDDSSLDLNRTCWDTCRNGFYENDYNLYEVGLMDEDAIELLNAMDRENDAKRRPSFATSQDEIVWLFEKYDRRELASRAGEFLEFCEDTKIRKPCAALQAMFKSKAVYLIEDFRIWLHQQRTKDALRFEKSREKEYANDNFKSKSFKSKSLAEMAGEFAKKNNIEIDNDSLQSQSTTTEIPAPTLPTEETKDFMQALLARLAANENKPEVKTIRTVKDCSFTLE